MFIIINDVALYGCRSESVRREGKKMKFVYRAPEPNHKYLNFISCSVGNTVTKTLALILLLLLLLFGLIFLPLAISLYYVASFAHYAFTLYAY